MVLHKLVFFKFRNPRDKSQAPAGLVTFCLICLLLWLSPFRILAQGSSQENEAAEKGGICDLDEQEFTIQGKSKALLRVHRIFRIYNDRGKEYGRVFAQLNEFMDVVHMEAQVKCTDGTMIKKLGKDDIQEESMFPNYVLYEKTRVKHFDLSTVTFPYILEYSFEIRFNSLFFWPGWHPQMEIPVKRSVYRLTVPNDFVYKMRQRNLEIQPVENKSGGKRQMVFELLDVPAFKKEKNMPSQEDYQMSVLFAAQEFDLMGYPGSNSSWNLFGKWYFSLANGKYLLSPDQKRTIQYLTERYPSSQERVKALYRYLQSKTHYVAIYLGIGGFMPRDAQSVLTSGYGDCKDLATLLIALLDAVGIKAYPALLRTRDEGLILADFPSNQFNHAIVFVPLEKDTFWLDCTSNYCPFGELPWTDEGCDALVIKEEDATIIKTPLSCATENRVTNSLQAKLALDGSIEITGQISATGNPEVHFRDLLNLKSTTEKKEWLGRLVGTYAPDFSLSSYDFDNIPNLDAPFTIRFGAKLIKYATKSKNELLMNLNLLTRMEAEEIPNEKGRKYPVDNGYLFEDQSEVVLDFPDSLSIKAVPENRDIVSSYGSFKAQYRANGNRLIYKRVQIINQELVQPEDFQDFKAFLNKIYLADHSFVVFNLVK